MGGDAELRASTQLWRSVEVRDRATGQGRGYAVGSAADGDRTGGGRANANSNAGWGVNRALGKRTIGKWGDRSRETTKCGNRGSASGKRSGSRECDEVQSVGHAHEYRTAERRDVAEFRVLQGC